jgi:hypothetical protein
MLQGLRPIGRPLVLERDSPGPATDLGRGDPQRLACGTKDSNDMVKVHQMNCPETTWRTEEAKPRKRPPPPLPKDQGKDRHGNKAASVLETAPDVGMVVLKPQLTGPGGLRLL